jgi:hypothetical protein
MMHEEFEDFWEEVVEFSEQINTDLRYVEEEFIIDGELVKAYPNPPRSPNKEYRFDPRPGSM